MKRREVYRQLHGLSREGCAPNVACGCMGAGLVIIVAAAEPKGAYARLSMSNLPCPCRAAFARATSTGDEKLEPEPVIEGEAGIAAKQTTHTSPCPVMF